MDATPPRYLASRVPLLLKSNVIDVTLSVGATILVPYLVVELQRSWGAGARGFHLRVPNLQVGGTSMRVVQGVNPGVSGRVTCPAVAIVIIIIITTLLQKDIVPHDHCLVLILSIEVMAWLILSLFFSEWQIMLFGLSVYDQKEKFCGTPYYYWTTGCAKIIDVHRCYFAKRISCSFFMFPLSS